MDDLTRAGRPDSFKDKLRYVADMSGELAAIAGALRQPMLTYFLNMARVEAEMVEAGGQLPKLDWLMSIFGLTANLMSLGGLAIAIGMLVDAAVVVVENTVESLAHQGPASRLPRLHLVYRAASEVAVPVASGIVIICLVFLPLLSLQGLEGKLFAPVALTIVFALSGSLLLSLTLIPVIASLLLKTGVHGDAWLMRKLMPLYGRLLEKALAKPRRIFMGVGVVFALVVCGLIFAGVRSIVAPMAARNDADGLTWLLIFVAVAGVVACGVMGLVMVVVVKRGQGSEVRE